MSDEHFFHVIKLMQEEGEKLVNALNSSTGFSPENPNPLTVKMTRIIKEFKEEFGEINE